LAAAEYNIGHLRKEIDAAYDRLDEETSARVAAVAQETEQRTVGDRQLADRLQAASTGGLHVPLIGALWLLTGVILSTSSPELEKWLNGKPIFQSSSVAN
jgi:hypothetical protein